ncbi:MAG TPA: hypothetical protein VF855_13020 [Acidimicrobiales bacterium]
MAGEEMETAEPGDAAEVRRWRPWWRDRWLGVELVLIALAACVRLWQSWGVTRMVFQDSLKNLESAASYGWFDRRLWGGQRTPLVPVVMKVVGAQRYDIDPFIVAQVVIGVLAWALLACTLGRRSPGAWRWVVTIGVLLLSVTTPISMWDDAVLTESLSVSMLVLTTATAIWLVERRTWPTWSAFVASFVLLILVRDTHIVLSGLLALGLVVVVALTWRRHRRVVLVTVLLIPVLMALTAFGRWSTVAGARHVQPTRETLFVKILPYEDRFEWFADHGMPDADRLRKLRPGIYRDAQTGAPLFPLPDYQDAAWKDFNRWVHDDAQGVYNRWLMTHPVEALADWFRRPAMIWNSAGNSWKFYRDPGFKEVRIVDIDLLLFPPMWVVTGIFAGAVCVLMWARRRWWQEPVAVVGLANIALGIPHGIISWLGDPAEVSRHALVAIVQLRLGALAIIVLALPEAAAFVRSLPRQRAAAEISEPAAQ